MLADEDVPGFRSAVVMSDHYEGGRLAGEHLAQLGHRRLLTITGPAALPSSMKRLEGFMESCHEFDVEVHVGDFREESGYQAVHPRVRDGRLQRTGIFAQNDLMAAGAIRALRELGQSVPEDISVVGYDDMPFAGLLSPPLTSVVQPAYEIGASAASQLLGALTRGKAPPVSRQVLAVALAVRSSTTRRAAAAGSQGVA